MRLVTPSSGTHRTRCWSWLRLALTGVLVATLLSGCVIRVVYNQLDWLALWYVQDYLDLDEAQEEQAKALIARTLAWHRATQLPRYAQLAHTLLDGLGAPLGPRFVVDRYAGIVALWDALLRRVSPDMAALLQTLSDEQVEELFARLAKENRELDEDYSGISREERRAKQDKAILRAFRRFTGWLSPGQEALIASRTAKLHDLSADWLHRRAAWQQEFRVLLIGRKSNPEFTARFTDLLLNPNQFDSPGYRDLVVENQEDSFELVTEVLGTLSPDQSGHLRKNLATYASDFDALVRGDTKRSKVQ